MKRIAFCALMAVPLATSASAAVEFRGAGYLTNPTPACLDQGWSPVEFGVARYRPPLVGGNGPDTHIAFSQIGGAESFVLSTGALGTKFKAVQGGQTYSATGLFNARVRVTTLRPTLIDTTTQDVTIAGQIDGFDATTGCVFDFRFDLTKKP